MHLWLWNMLSSAQSMITSYQWWKYIWCAKHKCDWLCYVPGSDALFCFVAFASLLIMMFHSVLLSAHTYTWLYLPTKGWDSRIKISNWSTFWIIPKRNRCWKFGLFLFSAGGDNSEKSNSPMNLVLSSHPACTWGFCWYMEPKSGTISIVRRSYIQ